MADQEWHQWRSPEPRPPRPYYGAPSPEFDRPHVQEDTLKEAYLQIERKSFQFKLKENSRGRFLRVSEVSAGGRSAIIIPGGGLAEFQKLLENLVKAGESIPSKFPAPGETPG
jgi:hypothetical protein